LKGEALHMQLRLVHGNLSTLTRF